jgi:probable F420-dependent oxidoreductase
MASLTLHLTLNNFGPFLGADLARVVKVAVDAEEAGIDGVVVVDHVVMGARTDRYRWGPFSYPDPTTPWMEPLTTLAAIAGATSRVRLGTGIVIPALRPAAVLAKTVATLDVLSGGRVDLGVGGGWQDEEFLAVGLDPRHRRALFDETLAATEAFWTQAPASFDGDHISFADVWCFPQPLQSPLPVYVAGPLDRANVARIVRHGVGWIPIMGASADDIAAGVATLRAAFTEAGRDPATLQVRAPLGLARNGAGDPDIVATVSRRDALGEVGVTECVTALQPFCRTVDDAAGFLTDLGAAWSA